MYACIPVPLIASLKPDGISDDDIRRVFQQLGFETRYDESKIDASAGEITIGKEGEQRRVKIGCSAHHRDLGVRNLSADTPSGIRTEVQRYGIFTGASTLFHANLYVTRVNSGEITIWCQQESLERLIPFCTKIGNCLSKGPLSGIADIDGLKTSRQNFILMSGRAGGVISHGDLQFSRIRAMLKTRTTDIGLLLLTFMIGLVTLGLHFVPVQKVLEGHKVVIIDPLGSTVRAFVENSWPPSIIAVLTVLLTLSIALASVPRQHISWDWQN